LDVIAHYTEVNRYLASWLAREYANLVYVLRWGLPEHSVMSCCRA